MTRRRLVYLGSRSHAPGEVITCEGAPIEVGAVLPLERRRSAWPESRAVERLILGTHPTRADLLLRGTGIAPEHVRLYVSRGSNEVNDLKPIQPGTVRVNGRTLDHEWCSLEPGDEIDLAGWRFRWEVAD